MSSDEDRAKEILKGFKLYPFLFGDTLRTLARRVVIANATFNINVR